METPEATLTRLQPHQIVEYARRPHRVVRVNDCRAALLPVTKTRREITPQTGPGAGKTLVIESAGELIGISPNSELPIIGRWDAVTQTAVYFNEVGRVTPCAPPINLPAGEVSSPRVVRANEVRNLQQEPSGENLQQTELL